MLIIYKVKITKVGVDIKYDDPAFSGEPDNVERTGKGEARPSLYKAMNALLDEVINVCLLDTNGWDGAEVTGVTLKHPEDGIGVVITAQNKTDAATSPIINNTTYLDNSQVSPELKAKLYFVISEATDYLEGKRAQGCLFDSEAA